MITSWQIYWITRLDYLSTVISIGMVLIGAVFVIWAGFCIFALMDDEYLTKYNRYLFLLGGIFMFISFLYILIPTPKEIAVIYLAPKIINNEQVQQVPESLLKMLNVKMEQWLDEQIGKSKQEKEGEPK